MRNLFRFIIKFHFFILFIIIESFSLFLLIQNNKYQKASFLNSSNYITGYIYSTFHFFAEYLSLKTANYDLAQENVHLRDILKQSIKTDKNYFPEVGDSVENQQYRYIHAKVINNSVNMQNNYITLNKGRRQGIKPEMGVISPNGLVGIVKNVSENFSSVISVLNKNLSISTMIKKNGYYGSLEWDGRDNKIVCLKEIPYHVDISTGDTVVTSGYSAIFPGRLLIGIISDFELKEGSNFYDISVKLSNDFRNLSHVYIIEILLKEERLELERNTGHD